MRCEEFRDRVVEIVDGELEASAAREAEGHAAACRACSAELASAREEAKLAAEAMRPLAAIKPDPDRKREFIDRLVAPRPRLLPWAWAAVAAAALVAILLVTLKPPAAESYSTALQREVEFRLQKLAAREKIDGEAMEDVVAIETAAIEESLAAPVEVSLEEAPRELSSKDMARRAGARRALAKAPPASLTALRVQDPAAARYVRALTRTLQDAAPRPEGRATISIHQKVNDRSLSFEQYANGVIHVVAEEGESTIDAWAHDIYDLMARQPEFCQKFGIVGGGGQIKIGSGIKSAQTIRSGMSVTRSYSEMHTLRMEALSTEIMRVKGDPAAAQKIVTQVEQRLKGIELDEPLRALRARATDADRTAADRLENAWQEIRRLELFCDQLQTLKE